MLIAFPFLSPAAAQFPMMFSLSFTSGPISAIVSFFDKGSASLLFFNKTQDIAADLRAASKYSAL